MSGSFLGLPRRRIFQASVLLTAALAVRSFVRHRRKMNLAAKVVLITGGSRGLGLALARQFARHNSTVAICARTVKDLMRATADIRELGCVIHTFVCDLRDELQIANLIQDVEKACGPIDLLVNNAGLISVGPVETMTLEDFQEAMDVNFWSAVRTSLAVIPGMRARGSGRIINIASIGGKIPVPHLNPYCASKFALVGFSGALRSELAKDGILVTTVDPGLMRTGSPRYATFKGKHSAEYTWFAISDGLPGLSMDAARAAKRIVCAATYGEAEVVLGLPAKLAAASYGLAPGLNIEMAALLNRLLPRSSDRSKQIGRDSESWMTRSVFAAFNHRAEKKYNQISNS